jgi:hypothetical protein
MGPQRPYGTSDRRGHARKHRMLLGSDAVVATASSIGSWTSAMPPCDELRTVPKMYWKPYAARQRGPLLRVNSPQLKRKTKEPNRQIEQLVRIRRLAGLCPAVVSDGI